MDVWKYGQTEKVMCRGYFMTEQRKEKGLPCRTIIGSMVRIANIALIRPQQPFIIKNLFLHL